MDALYTFDGEQYVATELTRGPWDDRHQHGGPPSALLGRALDRLPGDFALARITIELLRPVPLGALRVAATIAKDGRSVQRVEAVLSADGAELCRASGVRIRRHALDLPAADPGPAVPPPDSVPSTTFSFFRAEIAYHRAVEARFVRGAWGDRDIVAWFRPRVALVAGEGEMGPVERVLVLADAQSGLCPPLDPLRYSFVNPDLTVYFERPVEGTWVGFATRAAAHPHGVGFAETSLFDARGTCGRSAQVMVVAAR